MGTFYSCHTHSRYSAKDALPTVEKLVRRAVDLHYPALGLTDHGNMGGAAQLYTACRKEGIEPLPGEEFYVALDRSSNARKTMHLGMLATTDVGYRNLVGLSTQSHKQFHYKPVLDLADLAAASADGRLEGVVATSGCWFGLLPTMLREGDPIAVRNMLTALDSWFDGFYVELQHHNIADDTHDDATHVAVLHGIATSLGLPVVITQDSHYCDAYDRGVHETMKRLMSWSADPDDAIFPGDGYHMVDVDWMRARYTPAQLSDGLAGLDDLLGRAKVVIPELDSFRLAVPDSVGDPDAELRDKAANGLARKVASGAVKASHVKAHRQRIEDELAVVTGAGFSGYLLLFARVCQYMDDAGIAFSVRGSASGSELCWLLNITRFDPIAWGLPFDRFLSTDRTKPPDIDVDVEHRRRDQVIAWMESHYHVAKIGTWLQMGLDDDSDDQKGSLLVRYRMHQRKTGQDPTAPIPDEVWAELRALSDTQTYLGYGVHAAGLLITPDEATAACVPMAWVASSKTLITAFGKKDVERMGLVKGDFLGLKTLTAVSNALKMVGLLITDIPFNDARTYQLIRTGRTAGLFQLEGGATTTGVTRLRPRTIGDVIAAMALFRPAAMDSGATDAFIRRRRKEEVVPARHPIIETETKATYGVLLYQEQALNVMKALGLTVAEVEMARDAIKASNANVGSARIVLEKLRAKIATAAHAQGMSQPDVDWLDSALDAYAGYGFNKAHATAYGVLAYVTAWLRTNHPVEFWAGMLDAYSDSTTKVWSGPRGQRAKINQVDAYRMAAHEDGVHLLGPHVNKSKKSWAVDGTAIRAGLNSIKGVGQVASAELLTHAPYTDLSDLVAKVSPRRVTGTKQLALGHSPEACGGVVAALHTAGALKGLAPVPPPPPKVRKSRKKETE